MNRVLVNIRGTNGAGKSTIPMSMIQNDPEMRVEALGTNKKGGPGAPYITVFPQYRWVALGSYHAKTGGLDTYKTNAMTKMALDYAIDKYPEYDVLMEGIIASTIKSTYAIWFQEIEKEHPEIQVIVLSFVPPLEVCLARVQQRNGGKPVREDQIASKWRAVKRNVRYFKQCGLTSLRVNNANCPKDKMLVNFVRLIYKNRRSTDVSKKKASKKRN